MLEFSIPVAGDVAVLRELPPNVKIGLGCVDVRFPGDRHARADRGAGAKALEHVAAERLTLNPDCGFAPGKDHEIPLEEAYLKIRSLPQPRSAPRRVLLAHSGNAGDFVAAVN